MRPRNHTGSSCEMGIRRHDRLNDMLVDLGDIDRASS
jgi:hypothetical protein